jgi:hypothetical protein
MRLAEFNWRSRVAERRWRQNFCSICRRPRVIFQNMETGLTSRADTAGAVLALDQAFDKKTFFLRQLFRDEQRKITNTILNEPLTSAAAVYRRIFESQAPLIRFLNDYRFPFRRR